MAVELPSPSPPSTAIQQQPLCRSLGLKFIRMWSIMRSTYNVWLNVCIHYIYECVLKCAIPCVDCVCHEEPTYSP